jgi:hypothetical protein
MAIGIAAFLNDEYNISLVHYSNYTDISGNAGFASANNVLSSMRDAGAEVAIIADVPSQFQLFSLTLQELKFAPDVALITTPMTDLEIGVSTSAQYWTMFLHWHESFGYGVSGVDMGTSEEYAQAFARIYQYVPGSISAMGSAAGLLLQKALAISHSFDPEAVRQAVYQMDPLEESFFGRFAHDPVGANLAQFSKLGQILENQAVIAITPQSPLLLPAPFAWREEEVISCLVTGCGAKAYCPSQLQGATTCVCQNYYEPAFVNAGELFSCVPAVAGSGQQRVFWTVSLLTCVFGVLSSGMLLWAYAVEKQLNSNVTQLSFLSMIVPDFVFALCYMVTQFVNMVRGRQVSDGACAFLGFITFGVVIASFAGPIICAFVIWKQLVGLEHGKIDFLRIGTLSILLALPWVLGFALAAVAQRAGVLGNYRGLYCYTTDFELPITGGLTMGLFLCSCVLTGALYYDANAIVRAHHSQAKDDLVLKRGLLLIAVYFLTWILWALNGLLSLLELPPPVTVETIGAVMITLQPIIDFWVLMRVPKIKQTVLNLVTGDRKSELLLQSSTSNGSTHGSTQRSTAPSSSIKVTI